MSSVASAESRTLPEAAATEFPTRAHELDAPRRTEAGAPLRPAWVEIDLRQLKQNFQLINHDKPRGLKTLSVVKDEAYGQGAGFSGRYGTHTS